MSSAASPAPKKNLFKLRIIKNSSPSNSLRRCEETLTGSLSRNLQQWRQLRSFICWEMSCRPWWLVRLSHRWSGSYPWPLPDPFVLPFLNKTVTDDLKFEAYIIEMYGVLISSPEAMPPCDILLINFLLLLLSLEPVLSSSIPLPLCTCSLSALLLVLAARTHWQSRSRSSSV